MRVTMAKPNLPTVCFICVTCGNQYAATEQPPLHCPICEDERQYVNPEGQAWTTLEELKRDHHNIVRSVEPGLTEIATVPKFAIGQRALLVQTSKGNVLWDCVSLIDNATIEAIEALGGISALAMSHPHMFGSMVEWSHAFGKAPIYLHSDFKQWIQRPDPVIEFWEGETRALDEGVTLQLLWRPFHRLDGTALAGRRAGTRRALEQRHPPCDAGSPPRFVHV